MDSEHVFDLSSFKPVSFSTLPQKLALRIGRRYPRFCGRYSFGISLFIKCWAA